MVGSSNALVLANENIVFQLYLDSNSIGAERKFKEDTA